MPGSFKSLGAHGRGSKINMKPEYMVYRFMGMSRMISKIIKIFSFIVIIILCYIVWKFSN